MSAARAGALTSVRAFFGARIWDVRLRELPRPRAALYWVARVLHAIVTGLFDDRLSFRAAALTYFTVLSVVPFLAFAFAVLKGFGVYATFIEGTVQPYVDETFAANETLYDAITRILQFVDQTDVSRLGTLGVVVLAYAAVALVANVETALNHIFGAKSRRPLLRQVTDYVTLLVIAPLLLLVATTLSAAAQSSSVVRFLRESLRLGPIIDFSLGLGALAGVAVALFAMYVILPNVRVRVRAALAGAAVAALLWQGALVLHVRSQMGVARYNALYSVLGAIPIFLVWTYVSWLVVLVGARIAALHQGGETRPGAGERRADPELDEALAVALAARVARDFVEGVPPRPPAALAEHLDVPAPMLERILAALVRAGILARVVSGRGVGFLPARDVDAIRAEEVRDALRHDPEVDPLRSLAERRLEPGLVALLREADERRRASPQNLTLRELASLERGRGAASAPARAGWRREAKEGGDDGGAPVVDEKQPDVPA